MAQNSICVKSSSVGPPRTNRNAPTRSIRATRAASRSCLSRSLTAGLRPFGIRLLLTEVNEQAGFIPNPGRITQQLLVHAAELAGAFRFGVRVEHPLEQERGSPKVGLGR